MNNDYLVTFILPVYNVELEYLKECINSIFNQVNKNYELIIIDDGANEYLKTYLATFKTLNNVTILNQRNKGVSAARNKGIKLARGKWIVFIDSDDYISNNYVNEISNIDPSYDIILFDYYEFKGEEITKKTLDLIEGKITDTVLDCIKKGTIHKLYVDHNIQKYAIETIWNKAYKKSLFENFAFNEELKKGEDRLLNLEMFSIPNVQVLYLKKACYLYRKNIYSVSNSYSKEIIVNSEKSLKSLNSFIQTLDDNSEYWNIYYLHVCTRIYSYLRLYYLNEKSGYKYFEIRNQLKKLRKDEKYKIALNNLKFIDLTVQEFIFILLFKYHAYDLCICLAYLKMRE